MKFIKAVLVLLALNFISCENTEVVEVDIAGEEFTVVQGEVRTGQLFSGVRITRTLPVGVEYDIKDAEISDAYAYIQINGIRVIPLHYTSDGVYKTLYDDLRVNAGDTYELFIKYNDKAIYSKTVAPLIPDVVSVNYNSSGYFETRVRPNAGEAYGAAWLLFGAPQAKTANFYTIVEAPEGSQATVSTRTEKLPNEYLGPSYRDYRRVRVYAFDKEFASYFNTKAQGDPEDNNVLIGGSEVSWNVFGKKTIGLFIGVSESVPYDAE